MKSILSIIADLLKEIFLAFVLCFAFIVILIFLALDKLNILPDFGEGGHGELNGEEKP